ncbi:uncharacterized protein LOC143875950 [Tasmannia lanceolata]|uniref:uncharacterized protein LOC143875950 n=1 Tax=Tasmannia lanceolata TaxID=3420 RepID=UPI004063FA10
MGNKNNSPNKFIHYMKAPIRALYKARDFYVRTMINCGSSNMNYGGAVSGPSMASTLPKSFSTNSSRPLNEEDDLREVMKIASQKRVREMVEDPKPVTGSNGLPNGPNGLPKSYSVAFERIDEDQPCTFQEDFEVKPDVLYPRSRSYVVGKRRTNLIP